MMTGGGIDEAYGLEVERTVRGIGIKLLDGGMRARAGNDQGVTVGGRLRHAARSDGAAGAGHILDDDLLAQGLGHRRRNEPRDRVGWAAGLKRRHDGDEPGWIVLRERARRANHWRDHCAGKHGRRATGRCSEH